MRQRGGTGRPPSPRSLDWLHDTRGEGLAAGPPGNVRRKRCRFEELCYLLKRLGFDERVRGSHHIFTRERVEEILNLQARRDGKAKPYQVKQVREVIVKHKLGADIDET